MRGAKPRESSPRPGISILMTSAPKSARFIAQKGPASTRLRSRTRIPRSGFCSIIDSGPLARGLFERSADSDARGQESDAKKGFVVGENILHLTSSPAVGAGFSQPALLETEYSLF